MYDCLSQPTQNHVLENVEMNRYSELEERLELMLSIVLMCHVNSGRRDNTSGTSKTRSVRREAGERKRMRVGGREARGERA